MLHTIIKTLQNWKWNPQNMWQSLDTWELGSQTKIKFRKRLTADEDWVILINLQWQNPITF